LRFLNSPFLPGIPEEDARGVPVPRFFDSPGNWEPLVLLNTQFICLSCFAIFLFIRSKTAASSRNVIKTFSFPLQVCERFHKFFHYVSLPFTSLRIRAKMKQNNKKSWWCSNVWVLKLFHSRFNLCFKFEVGNTRDIENNFSFSWSNRN
jgi:hypothetical protein